jgi:DNA-binding XRE family transcriptional regulator
MSAGTDISIMSSIKDMSFTRDRYIMSAMKDINLRTAEQLGAAIRLKRKEKNLTQSELAKLLGAERKWVINLESGNSRAEIGLVLRALEALNLRASITDGEKPKTRGTLRDA